MSGAAARTGRLKKKKRRKYSKIGGRGWYKEKQPRQTSWGKR